MSKYDALRAWIRQNGSDRFSPAFAGRTIGNYPSPPASDVTKNCDEPEETLKRKKICAIIRLTVSVQRLR